MCLSLNVLHEIIGKKRQNVSLTWIEMKTSSVGQSFYALQKLK